MSIESKKQDQINLNINASISVKKKIGTLYESLKKANLLAHINRDAPDEIALTTHILDFYVQFPELDQLKQPVEKWIGELIAVNDDKEFLHKIVLNKKLKKEHNLYWAMYSYDILEGVISQDKVSFLKEPEINKFIKRRGTIIYSPVRKHNNKCAKYILELVAKSMYCQVSQYASQYNNYDFIKWGMENVPGFITVKNFKPALSVAIEKNNLNIVKLLLSQEGLRPVDIKYFMKEISNKDWEEDTGEETYRELVEWFYHRVGMDEKVANAIIRDYKKDKVEEVKINFLRSI